MGSTAGQLLLHDLQCTIQRLKDACLTSGRLCSLLYSLSSTICSRNTLERLSLFTISMVTVPEHTRGIRVTAVMLGIPGIATTTCLILNVIDRRNLPPPRVQSSLSIYTNKLGSPRQYTVCEYSVDKQTHRGSTRRGRRCRA